MSTSRVTPLWFGAVLGLAFALAILLVWTLSDRFGNDEVIDPVVQSTPRQTSPPVRAQPDPGEALYAQRENAIVRAIRRVSPAVVSISTMRTSMSAADFFHGGRGRAAYGLGSGVIVDERGYVLTCNHIVAGSTELRITLTDGQSFAAELVGSSPNHDLALVKIAGTVSGLPTAPLGDSDQVLPGEWAIALGSPYSYMVEDAEPTVTVGVISAVDRSVTSNSGAVMFREMIQTDAAINPGNSGGPLVDVNGTVIGINSSVITNEAGSRTSLGFAIPMNRGRCVMEELLEHGEVRRYTAGLTGGFLEAETRARFGIGDELPMGFRVSGVAPDSPASRAGLRPGDVIVRVDGEPLIDKRSRDSLFFEARVGLTLVLTVWRDGETFDVEITLEEE
jgi:serine protease Do